MSSPTVHPEEKDQAELLSTAVTPGTAKAMAWIFAMMLFAVPFFQAASELSRHQPLQAFEIFQPIQLAAKRMNQGDSDGAVAALKGAIQRQFPKTYEEHLEAASVTKQFFQPRLQEVVTGTFRFGNDKGVVGRDNWLFYQPGVDYLAGPDITDAAYLRLAAKKMIDLKGEHDPQPDPRPAIIAFNQDLLSRGVHLVLLPIPDKAMLQPEQLTPRMQLGDGIKPPNNRGYKQFVDYLQRQGVDIYDPTPEVVRSGEVRYLSGDTHWTPQFMDIVAKGVATHITETVSLPLPTGRTPSRLVDLTVARVGDLVDMLKLPANQKIYQPQSITTQQVVATQTGQAWEPDSAADVLLLGDSFTNIYSQTAMGWGSAAGFAEHLSYHLGRPLDVIAFNGAGATASRAELARPANAERVLGKKVIVFQIAMRFLMGENWKLTPHGLLVPAKKAPIKVDAAGPASQTGEITVTARVTKTSKVPAPGTAPYKDCLTYIALHIERLESGTYSGTILIAAFKAMEDNVWLPPASYAVGDKLHLKLVPMSRMDRQTQSMQKADDLDDFTHQVYFVTGGGKK